MFALTIGPNQVKSLEADPTTLGAIAGAVLAAGAGAAWYRRRHNKSDTEHDKQASPSEPTSPEPTESETNNQQPAPQERPQRDPETDEFVRHPSDDDQDDSH